MNDFVENGSYNYKSEWWRRFIAFIGMVIAIYVIAFNTIPGLIRNDIHKLPDGLLYLFFVVFFFGGWCLWKPNETAAGILTVIMVVLLISGTVTEMTINKISFLHMLPFFLIILMYLTIAAGFIQNRLSKSRIQNHEPPQDPIGESEVI